MNRRELAKKGFLGLCGALLGKKNPGITNTAGNEITSRAAPPRTTAFRTVRYEFGPKNEHLGTEVLKDGSWMRTYKKPISDLWKGAVCIKEDSDASVQAD